MTEGPPARIGWKFSGSPLISEKDPSPIQALEASPGIAVFPHFMKASDVPA